MTRKLCSLLAATMLIGGLSAPAMAEPGGCLKYGAAGAVGGHIAHKHGVLGAIGGCAVGMYQRHKYRKSIAAKAALWDKEHAADNKQGGVSSLQNDHSASMINQKAQWYDSEHPEAPQAQQAAH